MVSELGKGFCSFRNACWRLLKDMPFKKKHKGKVIWVGRVQIQGHKRQKHFKTKAEAKSWESQMKQDGLVPAQQQERVKTNAVTAYEFANQYLDYAKDRFTLKTYNEKRDAFQRLFRSYDKSLPAHRITPAVAYVPLRERANEVSGYSANKDRKNLVAAWNWGIKYLNLPKDNPFQDVERFAEVRKPREVPSLDDFWAVYDVGNEQDKLMLLTYLHTGARKSEILNLTWADVDLDNSRVRLWTRKRQGGTREDDWIPLTQELCEGLRAHQANSNSIHVFVRPDTKKPYKHRQHWLKYLCGLAGVKRFNIHSLRHLSASMLDDAGCPLTSIQAILRHKSANTTARYLHSLQGAKVALDAVFSRGKGRGKNGAGFSPDPRKPLPEAASLKTEAARP